MRKSQTQVFLALFLALLCAVGGLAQQLGGVSFGYAPAHKIDSRGSLRGGLGIDQALASPGFLASVGGVAFGKIARPASGLTVDRVAFDYDPAQPDGLRLALRINDIAVSLPVHDWLLAPIAKFADSEEFSVVTAFGTLVDAAETARIQSGGGYVFNYHPAFENTLLGLRLVQADMLVMHPHFSDLPKIDGVYLLASGESEPTPEEIFSRSRERNRALEEVDEAGFRSYVLTDGLLEITFQVRDCQLVIEGEPYYYFWRFRQENPAFDEADARRKAERSIERDLVEATDPKGKLIEGIFEASRWLEENKIASVSGNSEEALRTQSEQWLKSWLERLRTAKFKAQVEGVDLSSTRFGEPSFVRSLNPAVYDAARTTMRLAAFFRFLKQKDAEQWTRFLEATADVDITPAARTPTSFEPHG